MQNPEDLDTKNKFIAFYNEHQKELERRAEKSEGVTEAMWFTEFFMNWEKAFWDYLENLKENKSVSL